MAINNRELVAAGYEELSERTIAVVGATAAHLVGILMVDDRAEIVDYTQVAADGVDGIYERSHLRKVLRVPPDEPVTMSRPWPMPLRAIFVREREAYTKEGQPAQIDLPDARHAITIGTWDTRQTPISPYWAEITDEGGFMVSRDRTPKLGDALLPLEYAQQDWLSEGNSALTPAKIVAQAYLRSIDCRELAVEAAVLGFDVDPSQIPVMDPSIPTRWAAILNS